MTDRTAREIAAKLTMLRKQALLEIGEAGEQGLGFGRSSVQARRYLRTKGLAEWMPHKGGPFDPMRDRLTPLGLSVRQLLEQETPPHD
jgi:hypothetical protein